LTLIITQASTAVSVTFPASVKWADGTIPDLDISSADFILVFVTVNGGTAWRGFLSGKSYATPA
jgi:hypothetical protein